MVQRVVVAVQGESERVQVTIEWVGGAQTTGEIVRPVARLDQLSYYPHLCARVRQLAAEGLPAAAIAERLNADGYRPPKRRERFGAQGVQELLQRLGVRTKQNQVRRLSGLGPQEWGLRELAQELGMPHVTLYNWIGRGWVTARREPTTGRWIVWADEAEIARLQAHHRRSLSDDTRRRWANERSMTGNNEIGSE